MTAQPRLDLSLRARVALVDMRTAAAMAEVHPDVAATYVQDGTWPWAFDLATGGTHRAIHVWQTCVTDRALATTATEPDVLNHVIGTQADEVRGAALEIRWGGIDAHVFRRLLKAGELQGRVRHRVLWLTRTSLLAFLAARHRRCLNS